MPYATFGDPQSLNLYTYVGNNPNTGIDLGGHDPGSPNQDADVALAQAWGGSSNVSMALESPMPTQQENSDSGGPLGMNFGDDDNDDGTGQDSGNPQPFSSKLNGYHIAGGLGILKKIWNVVTSTKDFLDNGEQAKFWFDMQTADLQTQKNDMGASIYGDRYRLALDQAKLDLDTAEYDYYRVSQLLNIQNVVGGDITPLAGGSYVDGLRQQIAIKSNAYYEQRDQYMGQSQ